MLKHIPVKFAYFLFLLLLPLSRPAHGAALAQHSHGHDCTTAGEITLNSDVTDKLANTTDYAVYRLSLKERGTLDVWVDAGALDMWGMELLDASCRLIPNAIADESLITGRWAEITVPHKGMVSSEQSIWTLAAGTYFVRIRPDPIDVFQNTFTFHTKFRAHYGHDCSTAEPLRIPGVVEAELLYREDREVFRITTTKTGRIHARTTGALAPPRKPLVKLNLADCSNKPDLQITSEATGFISPVLPPGTYYLSVEPWRPDYLGRFTLHVEFKESRTEITQQF